MTMLAALIAVWLAQDAPQRARELIERLNDSDLVRRTEAARELRALDPKDAEVDRLLDEASRSADPDVAGPARSARIYRRLFPLVGEPDHFLERLGSPRNDVRWRAIDRLMQMGTTAAPLLADLFNDIDPQLRGRVVEFLAQTRDPRYIETVRGALPAAGGNEVWYLHKLAMLGDASVAPRLREIFAAHPVPRPDVVQGLGMLRLAEDIPLMRSLLYEDVNATATTVVFALANWPEAKAAAARDLHRLSIDGVWEAMLLAAEVPEPGLAAVLKERLTRSQPVHMGYPAFALASLGDRDAVPYLLHLVRGQHNVAVGLYGLGRLRAREAIWLHRRRSRSGDDDIEAALRRVLADVVFHNQQNVEYRARFHGQPRPGPREEGLLAWAIGQVEGPDAEAALIDLLTNGPESSRYEACLALGRSKSRRAVPLLVEALQDATAFERVAPPDDSKSVHAAFHQLRAAPGWAQVREAALRGLAASTGEAAPAGTLDEQVRFWTEWWAANAAKYQK